MKRDINILIDMFSGYGKASIWLGIALISAGLIFLIVPEIFIIIIATMLIWAGIYLLYRGFQVKRNRHSDYVHVEF